MGGLFQINPVTKTGQRLYMVHIFLKIINIWFHDNVLGSYAAASVPPYHGSDHPKQHNSQ